MLDAFRKKGFHMYILALNCGSSSLKYQVFDAGTKTAIVGGNVEKIGLPDSFVTQKYPDGTKQKKETSMKNHDEALNVVLFMLREASIDLNEIGGVGHRVVMGGDKFASSVEITDEVIKTIDKLSPRFHRVRRLIPCFHSFPHPQGWGFSFFTKDITKKPQLIYD